MAEQFPLPSGSSIRILTEPDRATPLSLFDVTLHNSVCVRKIKGKRETWRISSSDGTFYIKFFFNNTFFRLLLSVLKLSNFRKEISAYRTLQPMGILVPELIGQGHEYGMLQLHQKEFIITREVPDSERAKDFFFSSFQQLLIQDKKRLATGFAAFIRKLHDHGVIHTDPNLGNFLIQQTNSHVKFFLLDLGDVKIKKKLDTDERLQNLALINLNFHRFASKSLRYSFFKAYFSRDTGSGTNIRNMIKRIESNTLRFAQKNWAKRLRWSLENNDLFAASKQGRLTMHVKKAWLHNPCLSDIIASPDNFLDGCRGPFLKDGRTVKAARIDIGNNRFVFLKRYNRKGFFHTFKNIFRASRAKRVWQNSFGLELRGIPVPDTFAYMEERRFRILLRSYVLTEFMPDTRTLSSVFQENTLKRRRISIMHNLGREVARMHKYGCLHGDLKWSNILIKDIEGTDSCFFVDFDGTKIKKSIGLSDVLPELSRIYIEMLKYGLNSEEKRAFFSSYCRQFNVGLNPDSLAAMASKSINEKKLG